MVALAYWIWCPHSDREVTGSFPTDGSLFRSPPKTPSTQIGELLYPCAGMIYMGCYQDSGNRVLADYDYFSDSNSPTECSKGCSDYKFFGVEAAHPEVTALTVPSNAIAARVHATVLRVHVEIVAVKTDGKEKRVMKATHPKATAGNRVLADYDYFSDSNSPTECSKGCSDYKFFGVE
ncbi:hypothetical protein DPMN_115705, partial [Dreissena polymorpha]